ncbi:exosortase N [Arsenicibacter rosenii]|uniref:Exosortase N n=1 Tax=Arsenicibacter rosenii TaxID=1750698 RepID=A0A1S2VIL9_9BACT|nr:exosortase N [Arsenicibacter rosenii]OIN58589.1 exosortase N [Arsenicibacter rosenii]
MITFDLTTILALVLFVLGLRTHWWPRLLTLLLLSPALLYVLTVFGFDIRLQLSHWAGGLLQLAGFDVQVTGNVLIRGSGSGHPVAMSVDPACAGLHMTGVSVLAGAYWLMQYETRLRRRLNRVRIGLLAATIFGLTLVSNLLRILVLVLLGIGPDTWLHDLVGLVCIVGYTWLPAWWLISRAVRRFGREAHPGQTTQPGWAIALLILGIGIKWITGLPETVDRKQLEAVAGEWRSQGFTGATLPNQFMKLEKPGYLVYLKPVSNWWSAEHSPAVCWRGSGYVLQLIEESHWRGRPCYRAVLQKSDPGTQQPGGSALYTYWWFSNGREQTISQIAFRWKMLWGAPDYVLVNVTMDGSGRQIALNAPLSAAGE